MPSRQSHTGRFLFGLIIILVLVAIIIAEFWGFLYAYGFAQAITLPSSSTETQLKDDPGVQKAAQILGHEYRSLSHPLVFTCPEGCSATTKGYDSPEFVVALDEDKFTDQEPGHVTVYHVETDLGMDDYAGILRDQMKKDGNTMIEDQPTSNSWYVLSGSTRQKAADGSTYTYMHAIFIGPVPASGSFKKGYLVFDLYDNLDSYQGSLDVLGNYVFPTLKFGT